MTSVTFPTNLGGDGSTVSDDSNPSTGLANGGHRTRFVPALFNTVAMAQTAVNSAQAAANSATIALNAPGTTATSTTSMSIGTGSRSFTLAQTGKAFALGQSVIIASTATPANWMAGAITAFNAATGAITVNVLVVNGSGTLAAWTVSLTAPIPSGTWPITAQNVADGAVTTQKLADGAATLIKLAAEVGDRLVPAGAVTHFARSTPSTGWLAANGAAVSRTTYAALFAAIGTTFGAGNGSTTFNVPDLRDRMPIGSGSLYALGATGGSKDAVVVSHNHSATSSVSDPGHAHTLTSGTEADFGAQTGGFGRGGPVTIATSSQATGISVSTSIGTTGSSATNANLPPYIGLLACIKF